LPNPRLASSDPSRTGAELGGLRLVELPQKLVQRASIALSAPVSHRSRERLAHRMRPGRARVKALGAIYFGLALNLPLALSESIDFRITCSSSSLVEGAFKPASSTSSFIFPARYDSEFET
jgi:hypothetical protein